MRRVLLALAAGLLLQLLPWPARWADAVFLGTTLPAWSSLTAPLVESSAGSLSALLLLLLLAASAAALLAGRRGRRALGRAAGGLLAAAALTFPFTFGLGYHTTPLEERLRPAGSVAAGASAGSVAPDAAAGPAAADTADAVPDPADDPVTARESVRRLVLAALVGASPPATPVDPERSAASAAAACLSEYLPSVRGSAVAAVPRRVKAVPEGWLLRLGFSGVVSPWLLEPHLDPALPGPAALAVALHELAHTAGFAREAEAEAVGLLAGLDCDDARVRYAAALRAATALAGELDGPAREAYLAQWPAAALADARAAGEVARRYRAGAVADVASRVYDTYLTSQGTGGMSDYARATDLLVLALGAPPAAGEPLRGPAPAPGSWR